MYESNVRETFVLENGGMVTEKLFGFELIADDVTVSQDVLAMGFDCGAPPEPAVSSFSDQHSISSCLLHFTLHLQTLLALVIDLVCNTPD